MNRPIVQQPRAFRLTEDDEWMGIPHGTHNLPRGLEYLKVVDHLLVKQKIQLLEVVYGVEQNNKYVIKNAQGQIAYLAVEDNDDLTLICGGGHLRPFHMKIFDNYRNEVIHLYRPLRCCPCCCCRCCLQTMEVSVPPGNVIGTIEQEWSCRYPIFLIKNRYGDTVLRIKGPICTCGVGTDVEFKVLSMYDEKVGKISKQWGGYAREMYTDADIFGINFPVNLDVETKAILLGATFLIDFMFFEDGGNRNRSASLCNFM